MIRQMCWLPMKELDGENVLHLRTNPNQPWRSYTAYPEHAVPEYKIPGGSKGWATYQKLVCKGWTLIPSVRAQESVLSR